MHGLPSLIGRARSGILGSVHAALELFTCEAGSLRRVCPQISGETPADIHCGQGIAARAVAVATGAYSVSDLAACGPHAVFTDLSATDQVVDAILR